MIKYSDIIQQTDEWQLIKWGKIGGTDSKALLGKDFDTIITHLVSKRLEEFEPTDDFVNEHTERGNNLEPFAREYLAKYLGLEFKEYGWLQSEYNEIIGISPDGLTKDDKVSCEIKCLGRKAHYDILIEGEIPLDKIAQCIHYFTVNESLESHYFLAFRPEAPKHFIKKLTRDSIVNIGTRAKPIHKSIKECVELSVTNADIILKRVKEIESQLLDEF